MPAVATPLKDEEHQDAQVEFSKSDNGPMFMQKLGAATDAEQHFADTKNVLGSCVGQTRTVDVSSEPMQMTMTEVSGATVGDENASSTG